jgi:3-oxoacyl-[acyl-carrier protein] reductase
MYCASKAALHHAVKVIARERASEFFSINCVAPGVTAGTEMTEHVDRYVSRARPELDHLTYERSQIPLGRRADPDEIAKVIVDVLYSPPYLNGAIIPVNGAR